MNELGILMAGREVLVRLDNDELFAELTARCDGFTLERVENPWMVVDLRWRRSIAGEENRRLRLERAVSGCYRFRGSVTRGELRLGKPHTVAAEVTTILTLNNALQLCLSLALPHEGALLAHADAICWDGMTIAFLGPSETGKSTAAGHLVSTVGAFPVSRDRTLIGIDSAGSPFAAPIPAINNFSQGVRNPRTFPLSALVFPRRGSGPTVRPLGRLESTTRFLGAVIFPGGDGQPIGAALDISEALQSQTWSAELTYWRGEDFSPLLERQRTTHGRASTGDQDREEPGDRLQDHRRNGGGGAATRCQDADPQRRRDEDLGAARLPLG